MKIVLRKSLGNAVVYECPSATGSGSYLLADFGDSSRCSCPGFQFAGHCKHTASLGEEPNKSASPDPEMEKP